MRKNKELGQVFLRDRKYVQRIIRSMDIEGKDVLEIGPGAGVMTPHLLKKAGRLWCVEIDPRWADVLRKQYGAAPGFTLRNEDILDVDIGGLSGEMVVFGNVPYHISYQLITFVVEQRGSITRAFMTFQKEFACKLSALPGSGEYSFISCYFQCFCQAEILFTIPRTAFSPSPKVDSAFTAITFRKEPACAASDEKALFRLIKTAFSQRRKKLVNALGARYSRKEVHTICDYAGVSSDARAGDVTVDQYARMLNRLKSP